MSDLKPITADTRPIDGAIISVPKAAYLLAALWIVVPAVQYIGAFQRTLAVTMRDASLGSFGYIDLTLVYVVVVGITAIYAIVRVGNVFASSETVDARQE